MINRFKCFGPASAAIQDFTALLCDAPGGDIAADNFRKILKQYKKPAQQAKALIDSLATDFDPGAYRDEYREELQQDAQSLGIDPQAVAAMREPVLIRVTPDIDIHGHRAVTTGLLPLPLVHGANHGGIVRSGIDLETLENLAPVLVRVSRNFELRLCRNAPIPFEAYAIQPLD